MQRQQRFLDAEVREQLAGVARVLGADRRDRLERVERARRQVGEVADRRGDDVTGCRRELALAACIVLSTCVTGRILTGSSWSACARRMHMSQTSIHDRSGNPAALSVEAAAVAPCCWRCWRGCSTVQASAGAAPARPRSARPSPAPPTLARKDATLSGQAKQDNVQQHRAPARRARRRHAGARSRRAARGRTALQLRRTRAAQSRTAAAASVRSRRQLAVRCRQPPARRQRRLSPAAEAGGAAAAVRQPRHRRRAGARWPADRLLR